MNSSNKQIISFIIFIVIVLWVIFYPIYEKHSIKKNGEYVVDILRMGKEVKFRCDNWAEISFIKGGIIEMIHRGTYEKYEIVKSDIINLGVRHKTLTFLLKLVDYQSESKDYDGIIEMYERIDKQLRNSEGMKELYRKHRFLGVNFEDNDLPKNFTERDILLLSEWTISTSGIVNFEPNSEGDNKIIEVLSYDL